MGARWVVGIDGSDAAIDALRWAVAHSAGREVEITALGAFHVSAMMALFTAKRGFGVDELGLAAVAGHDVDVAIESATASHPDAARVQPLVVEGQAPHVLIDATVDAAAIAAIAGRGPDRRRALGRAPLRRA